MADQERDPRAYELMTVFIPDLSDEDNQAEIEKIEGYITSNGGTMTETLTSSPWGRRRLAYTIHFNGTDYRDGFYTVYHFDMRPGALAELEREMKLDTNLMRYLLVHDDPKAGEKVTESDKEAAEGAESESGAAEGGQAAGGESAQAATETAAASDETKAEPAAATGDEAESETAPTSDETESAPTEEAPAKETVTHTAPPAADTATTGETTEKE